jgi:hypothetical protein
MEIYLEFFCTKFDTQEVQEAKSRGVTSKESNNKRKTQAQPNPVWILDLQEVSGTVGLIQMDQP